MLSPFSDADLAGDERSRKLISCGCSLVGKHSLKGWAKTHTRITLSSDHSELHATFRAVSEGLGHTDHCQRFANQTARRGVGCCVCTPRRNQPPRSGKIRHIVAGFLWIQQSAAEKCLKFNAPLGRDSPAHLYATYLDWETMRRHSERISVDFIGGRATFAP